MVDEPFSQDASFNPASPPWTLGQFLHSCFFSLPHLWNLWNCVTITRTTELRQSIDRRCESPTWHCRRSPGKVNSHYFKYLTKSLLLLPADFLTPGWLYWCTGIPGSLGRTTAQFQEPALISSGLATGDMSECGSLVRGVSGSGLLPLPDPASQQNFLLMPPWHLKQL